MESKTKTIYVRVPVSERLPEKEGRYLFMYSDGDVSTCDYVPGKGVCEVGEERFSLSTDYTHWLEEQTIEPKPGEEYVFTKEQVESLLIKQKEMCSKIPLLSKRSHWAGDSTFHNQMMDDISNAIKGLPNVILIREKDESK